MAPALQTGMREWRARAVRLRNRLRPAGAILAYHRVVHRKSEDPFHIEVQDANFEAQLRVLRDGYRVVSVAELAEEALQGRLTHRNTVAISFDDGYFDNLEVAAPLLRRFEYPATFFITTGYVEPSRGDFFWMRAAKLPDAKRADSFEKLRNLSSSARRSQEDALPEVDSDPLARPLRADELQTLLAGPRFELGAHTRSHGRLSSLQTSEVQSEVHGSKRDLEGWMGRTCSLFAYPFGQKDDVGSSAVEAVRSAGFRYAVTTQSSLVNKACEPLALPRITVPDVGGEAFAAWLRRRGLAPVQDSASERSS